MDDVTSRLALAPVGGRASQRFDTYHFMSDDIYSEKRKKKKKEIRRMGFDLRVYYDNK